MFKFFANLTRPKKYLIVSLLALILFSAGLVVALEVRSRNLASKQPVVAPLEIPAPVVAETPAPAPATQVATKVATTKKSAPKAPAPKPPKFIPKPPVDNPYRLIFSESHFTTEPGLRLENPFTIKAPGDLFISKPQQITPAGSSGVTVWFWSYYSTVRPGPFWQGIVNATSDAKAGLYRIEISAEYNHNTYKEFITVEVVERPTFFANAYQVEGTPPGSFSVIFSAIRKFGFSNPISMSTPGFSHTGGSYLNPSYQPRCEPLVRLSLDSYQLNCRPHPDTLGELEVRSTFFAGVIERPTMATIKIR